MKKTYMQPLTAVFKTTPSTIIATSATDATDNVGLRYGGGTSGDVSARTKDAGDWDIWE